MYTEVKREILHHPREVSSKMAKRCAYETESGYCELFEVPAKSICKEYGCRLSWPEGFDYLDEKEIYARKTMLDARREQREEKEDILVDELESDDPTLRVFRVFVKVAEQSPEEGYK